MKVGDLVLSRYNVTPFWGVVVGMASAAEIVEASRRWTSAVKVMWLFDGDITIEHEATIVVMSEA